jgi:hypothetical protein
MLTFTSVKFIVAFARGTEVFFGIKCGIYGFGVVLSIQMSAY